MLWVLRAGGRQEADAWPLDQLLHQGVDFRAIADERKNVTTIKLQYATSTYKILFWPHQKFGTHFSTWALDRSPSCTHMREGVSVSEGTGITRNRRPVSR